MIVRPVSRDAVERSTTNGSPTMKRYIGLSCILCVAGLCTYAFERTLLADDAGPTLGAGSAEAPQLGPATEGPPVPQPDAGEAIPQSQPDADRPEAATQDPTAQTPRDRALAHLEKAADALAGGRYDRAVREASSAISVDPEHAAEYREVRAAAYLAAGRYENALSDKTPIEVTVVAPHARLKSGKEIVATVPAGTRLLVDASQGNWLKVVSQGEQKFDWAWVHKRDVRAGAEIDETAPAPEAVGEDPVREGDEGDQIYVDPRSLPEYVPPDPYRGGPGGDYGRVHYDWWQNVPPQFWRFLPR